MKIALRKVSTVPGLAFAALLCLAPGGGSLHAQSALTPDRLVFALERFEDALNLREGPVAALRFLNGHIGDGTRMRFLRAEGAAPEILDKEAFVNAALSARKGMQDYALTLDPEKITVARDGVHADVSEYVTERGAPISGLSFTRAQRCESRFALAADGSLILSARTCVAEDL